MPVIFFCVAFAIAVLVRISIVLAVLFFRYVVPVIARMVVALVSALVRLARRWSAYVGVNP